MHHIMAHPEERTVVGTNSNSNSNGNDDDGDEDEEAAFGNRYESTGAATNSNGNSNATIPPQQQRQETKTSKQQKLLQAVEAIDLLSSSSDESDRETIPTENVALSNRQRRGRRKLTARKSSLASARTTAPPAPAASSSSSSSFVAAPPMTNTTNNNNNSNNSIVINNDKGKKVMDSFIQAGATVNAASSKKAIELHRMIIGLGSDDDDDDSDDYYKKIVLWSGGFSKNTQIDLLDPAVNNPNDSNSNSNDDDDDDGDGDGDGDDNSNSNNDNDNDNDNKNSNNSQHLENENNSTSNSNSTNNEVVDDDGDDDSSIDFVGVGSPNRPAMNARHLSGRQRRLEAVRNRNRDRDRDAAILDEQQNQKPRAVESLVFEEATTSTATAQTDSNSNDNDNDNDNNREDGTNTSNANANANANDVNDNDNTTSTATTSPTPQTDSNSNDSNRDDGIKTRNANANDNADSRASPAHGQSTTEIIALESGARNDAGMATDSLMVDADSAMVEASFSTADEKSATQLETHAQPQPHTESSQNNNNDNTIDSEKNNNDGDATSGVDVGVGANRMHQEETSSIVRSKLNASKANQTNNGMPIEITTTTSATATTVPATPTTTVPTPATVPTTTTPAAAATTAATTTLTIAATTGPKKMTARKSSSAGKAKAQIKATMTTSAFDNLFMNGKDFVLGWVCITDPAKFLAARAKDLQPQVNSWRKYRNLTPLNDPAAYIKTLRRQVRDNLQSIAATAKKRGVPIPSLSPHSTAGAAFPSTSATAPAIPSRRRSSQSLVVAGDAEDLPNKKMKSSSNNNNNNNNKSTTTTTIVYPSLENLPSSGGDFMKYMGITNAKDFLNAKNCHKHINEWRANRNMPPLQALHWRISQWKKWIRDKTTTTTTVVQHSGDAGCKTNGTDNNININTENDLDEGDDIDSSNCMPLVTPLSKRFLNEETDLPVYQFAVFDTLCKDTIYEFRVEAKPSWIPNAGNGAFLTFLGAREARCLRSSSSSTRDLDTASKVNTTSVPLLSKDKDGYHMNVRVTGKNLWDEKKDIQYYPPPSTSLPSIHGSPEKIAVDGNRYPWNLGPEGNRLLTEYDENPERLFLTSQKGCSTIELGRYGPFRRSDRKTQLHYDIKNFIFSNETSEWGFDIVEDLNGEEQVADVTDDSTGMPHHVAKQNICMYVNETGGNPVLKQTVWSKQVLDREVNYFFKTKKAMKKGETIEVLISYFGTYNEIRERKGYGEKNESGQVHSDEHFPTFLERNFIERYDMVEVIYEVKDSITLYRLSEFLEGIRSNLGEIVETFIRDMQSSSSSEGIRIPFAQQIVALRRLNWMKPYFLKKIENIQKKVDNSRDFTIAACQNCFLRQCTANAKCLEWGSWPILMDLLDKHPNLVDAKGVNLRTKFQEEVTEDICYGVNTTLFCPCNESLWCGVAATLTHDLCYAIARDTWDYKKAQPSANLSDVLMQKAAEASEAIRNPKSIDDLKFDTLVWKRYALNNRGNIAKEQRGTECVMTLSNDCKGPEVRLPAPVILRRNSSVEQRRILETIHKPWYLARQILFLVDIFAKKYLDGDKSYSFEALCQKIDVPLQATLLFLKRPVELDLDSTLFFGANFELIYSTGNNLHSGRGTYISKVSGNVDRKTKTAKPRNPGTTKPAKPRTKGVVVKKLLFWNVLVKALIRLKWSVARGNRPNDWYICPPGVERGKGFKPRVDFFDSATLVIQCLQTDKRYCNLPAIKAVLCEYKSYLSAYDKLRSTKNKKELKKFKGEEIIDHLKGLIDGSAGKIEMPKRVVQNDGKASVGKATMKVKVVFQTELLGLMLFAKRADGARVTVKEVRNKKYETQIDRGDVIIAIGDHETRNETLKVVCDRLKGSKRPVTITFERTVPPPNIL